MFGRQPGDDPMAGMSSRERRKQKWLRALVLIFSTLPLIVGGLYLYMKPAPEKLKRHMPPPFEQPAP